MAGFLRWFRGWSEDLGYRQRLCRVFERRNCGLYGGGRFWPPCCERCACVAEARSGQELDRS